MSGLVSADPRAGTELAGYRIEALVGRGAGGDTLSALDPTSGRRVALKLPHVGPGCGEPTRMRVERVCGALGDVPDKTVAPVLGVHVAGDQLVVVREWVEGEDLAQLLAAQAGLDPAVAIRLISQAARGLDAARWGRGVVHGNLKPANILVAPGASQEAEGQVRLVDFGLWPPSAHAALRAEAMSGRAVGYLAPELVQGEEPSALSDQYALACVMYECATGHPPFTGEADTVLSAHVERQPPSARESRLELSEGIDRAIVRALAKLPEDRFATCNEFAAALGSAAPLRVNEPAPRKPLELRPDPMPPPPSPPRSLRRSRRLALFAVIAAAAIVAGVLSFLALTDGGQPSSSDTGASSPVPVADAAISAPSATSSVALPLAWSHVPPSVAFPDDTARAGKMNGLVAGGPGLVAVGEDRFDAAVWTSTDGVAWSRVSPTTASVGGTPELWERMHSVTVGGPGLVAVGFAEEPPSGLSAAVWTSVDGRTWSRVPHDESVFGGPGLQELRSVTVGGPGLVAVGADETGGRDAAVWTSVDGLSWSRVAHDDAVFGGVGYQSINGVVAGGPGLVAVGRDGSVPAAWSATDAGGWSRIAPESGVDIFGATDGQAGRMNSVSAGGPGLVAVGTIGSNAAVWTSVDGINWTPVPRDNAVFGGESFQEMRSVSAGGPGLVAVGVDGLDAAVWTSADGLSWARAPLGDAGFGGEAHSMDSVTAWGSILVAVGADRMLGSFTSAVWTSP